MVDLFVHCVWGCLWFCLCLGVYVLLSYLCFLDAYAMNVVGWVWFIVGIVFLILVVAIFGVLVCLYGCLVIWDFVLCDCVDVFWGVCLL